MNPPRVGIVGARRARQGLGPFVIRDLLGAGADIPCLLTTSEASRDAALRVLRENHQREARGYLDLGEMLDRESLDALAVLSPAESHAGHLEAAARAGLHVLCEKPLVWGIPDLAERAASLVRMFEARALILWENCQWPYALPGLEALHSGVLATPPRHFEMLLQPVSRGAQRIGDAIPHPLSLLQRLAPGPASLEQVSFSSRDPEAVALDVRFTWCTPSASVDVCVHLEAGMRQPRETWVAVDGRRADRVVSPGDYQLSLQDAGRSVALADPLTLLIADFVSELISRSQRSLAGEIRERMRLLAELAGAYAREIR